MAGQCCGMMVAPTTSRVPQRIEEEGGRVLEASSPSKANIKQDKEDLTSYTAKELQARQAVQTSFDLASSAGGDAEQPAATRLGLNAEQQREVKLRQQVRTMIKG